MTGWKLYQIDFQTNLEKQGNPNLTNCCRPHSWHGGSQGWGTSCSLRSLPPPPPTGLGGQVLPGGASSILHTVCGHNVAGHVSSPSRGQTPEKPGVSVTCHSSIRKWLQSQLQRPGDQAGQRQAYLGAWWQLQGSSREAEKLSWGWELWLWGCASSVGKSEYNTDNDADNDADLKNANLRAINLLLYSRQLLVFHIYLWFITIWFFIDLLL